MHQRTDRSIRNPARIRAVRRLAIPALALALIAGPAGAGNPEPTGATGPTAASTRPATAATPATSGSTLTAKAAASRAQGVRPSPLLMLVMLLQKR